MGNILCLILILPKVEQQKTLIGKSALNGVIAHRTPFCKKKLSHKKTNWEGNCGDYLIPITQIILRSP